MTALMDGRKRQKKWVQKLLRRPRRHTDDSHQTQYHAPEAEPATEDEIDANRHATAQPSQQQTAQERRDAYVERWIVPWADSVCLLIAALRQSRDYARSRDLLVAHAECTPYYEDELARLAAEDEIELPEDDPREEYRLALSEWGRARHLRKIFRLTGTYPKDTGDMTTGEVYSWFLELHDAVSSYENAAKGVSRE